MKSRRHSTSPSSYEILFVYVIFLMFLSCLLYYETRSFIFISIGSGVSVAISVLFTLDAFRRKEIDLIRFSVYQSFIWYFGPLTYYPLLDTVGLLNINETELADSVILILICLGIGWVFSFFLNITVRLPREKGAFIGSDDFLTIILPLCCLQVVLMATGLWSYQVLHIDPEVAGDVHISPIALFTGSVTVGIAPLCAYNYGLLDSSQRTFSRKLLFLSIIGVQGIFFLMAERRAVLITTAFSVIMFCYGRLEKKPSLNQIIQFMFLAIILGVGLGQANKLFYKMRLASYSLGSNKSASVAGFFSAMSQVSDENLQVEISRNIAARPFIIDTVGVVQKYNYAPLYGEELLNDFLGQIPSIMYKNKPVYFGEMLWAKVGVPYLDRANSLVVDGYVDFRYFGFLILASLQGVILIILYKIALKLGPVIGYLCLFGFIDSFFHVEASTAGVIAASRSFIIAFILFGCVRLVTSPYSANSTVHFLGNSEEGQSGNDQGDASESERSPGT